MKMNSRWERRGDSRTEKGIKLERFAVKANQRGKQIGSKLVEAVIADVRSKEGSGQYLYLHAQLTAVPLYEKFGFEKRVTSFPNVTFCTI